VRVTLLQFATGMNKADNLETLTRLAREAAGASTPGPDLIVCPEAAMADFGKPDTPLGPLAEPLDGPFVQALGGLAKELGATIVAGMFEAAGPNSDPDPDRVYNTLVALGPTGELAGRYRKLHLYDAFGYRESDRLVPGVPADPPVVVPVAGHNVALLTCYDLRFPELSRLLAGAGADVLAIPAAWMRGPLKEDHWTTLVRARAIENTCYVAAAAQSGPAYSGRSMLVDPFGVQVAALGEQVGHCTGEVSAERVAEVRRINPTLAHTRYTIAPEDAP
jgi:predicted amidohydrolase